MGYAGSIPASYGTDLIELYLDPSLRGQELTVTLEGMGARFALQVWEVNGDRADRRAARLGARLGDIAGRPRMLSAQPTYVQASQDGVHVFTLSHLEPSECDRLALIITRLDAGEALDPEGAYRIDVISAAGAK
jgi:hypothetical protein